MPYMVAIDGHIWHHYNKIYKCLIFWGLLKLSGPSTSQQDRGFSRYCKLTLEVLGVVPLPSHSTIVYVCFQYNPEPIIKQTPRSPSQLQANFDAPTQISQTKLNRYPNRFPTNPIVTNQTTAKTLRPNLQAA